MSPETATTATSLAEGAEAIAATRGLDADRAWAQTAMEQMLRRQIAPEYAPLILRKALTELDAAHSEHERTAEAEPEPIEDLLGEPRAYVMAAAAELRAAGTPIAPPAAYLPPAEALQGWMLLTSGALFFVTISLLLADGHRTEVTPAYLILAPLIAAFATAARAIYLPLAARLGFRGALTVTIAALAVLAAGSWPLLTRSTEPAFDIATWWGFAGVPVCLLVAFIAGRSTHSPTATTTATTATATTDGETSGLPADASASADWFTSFEQALRLGGRHTDAAATRLAREAREHIADSGANPHEEFGAPAAYAAAMPNSRGVREFRMMLLWGAGAALAIYFLVTRLINDEFSWFTLVGVILFGGRALAAGLRYRQTRRGQTPAAAA